MIILILVEQVPLSLFALLHGGYNTAPMKDSER